MELADHDDEAAACLSSHARHVLQAMAIRFQVGWYACLEHADGGGETRLVRLDIRHDKDASLGDVKLGGVKPCENPRALLLVLAGENQQSGQARVLLAGDFPAKIHMLSRACEDDGLPCLEADMGPLLAQRPEEARCHVGGQGDAVS